MESATTDSEVALTKTITVSGERLQVDYRIEPPDTDAERVRLVEQFSESVGRAAISFGDNDRGQWTYRSGAEVAFLGEFDSSEPLEATLQIQSATLTPEDCASTVTVVPTDEQDWFRDARTNRFDNGSEVIKNGGSNIHGPTKRYDGTREKPAVGLVATDENAAAVARTTIRAIERGLSVFVAVDIENGTPARIAERLGATVIEVDIGDTDTDALATALAGTAQNSSHPGILFHGECHERMAFTESLERFEAEPESITEAVGQPARADILVGIPAYNEADTVGDVVHDASEYVDEVLVVDDGSSDETARRARKAGATVVEHDRNRGYGQALKTVFAEASRRDPDSLVILDGDDQHDTEDIPRLLEEQRESNAEIVIGSRFGESTETDIPLYRRFGLWVITVLTNLSFGSFRREARIQDTQSGFRSYDSTAVSMFAEHSEVIDDRMSASIDILSFAYDNDFTITEVPTTITYDVDNASSHNPVSHGLNIVNKILKTFERKRPITALGVPGVVLALAGVGGGLWTVSNYVSTGTVSLGFAFLSAVLVLTGLLSSFCSIVRHSLKSHLDGPHTD